MKPQFKLEEIYLDLSKLSEEQQERVMCVTGTTIEWIKYAGYLIYHKGWKTSNKSWLKDQNLTELTYSQFLDMMGESEEVLQVENDGWISVNEKPKTFQEVILYREDAGVFVGYYGNLAESLSEMALENHYNNEVSEETMWKEQFFYFGLEGNGILEGSEEPTHWMPLPEPPKF
jgi:hypothetical protein